LIDLFERKGALDFEDFVRSLIVFHLNAPQEDKIDCKFVRI
jgi:serine/threonine-protein phosphatase 2B regulatory subunit